MKNITCNGKTVLKIAASILIVSLVIMLSACSSSSTPSSAPTSPVSNPPTSSPAGNAVTIDITAQNVLFDKTSITVKAGAQVTMNFNNKDTMPHNVAIYNDSSASQVIYKGEVFNGPATRTYTFTAPTAPGTYFFRCDVHPTQMTGQFIVQ